ncbi:MAG: hypothetical protein ABR529_13085 [Actinomycetota bacterium]
MAAVDCSNHKCIKPASIHLLHPLEGKAPEAVGFWLCREHAGELEAVRRSPEGATTKKGSALLRRVRALAAS